MKINIVKVRQAQTQVGLEQYYQAFLTVYTATNKNITDFNEAIKTLASLIGEVGNEFDQRVQYREQYQAAFINVMIDIFEDQTFQDTIRELNLPEQDSFIKEMIEQQVQRALIETGWGLDKPEHQAATADRSPGRLVSAPVSIASSSSNSFFVPSSRSPSPVDKPILQCYLPDFRASLRDLMKLPQPKNWEAGVCVLLQYIIVERNVIEEHKKYSLSVQREIVATAHFTMQDFLEKISKGQARKIILEAKITDINTYYDQIKNAVKTMLGKSSDTIWGLAKSCDPVQGMLTHEYLDASTKTLDDFAQEQQKMKALTMT